MVNIAAMKIVIAPDSYKECLSAAEVAAALATGLRRVLPQAEILCVPLADGGEGTLQALTAGPHARRVTVMVNDALGAPVAAQYGVLADGRTAVIEIAEAIGLDKIPLQSRSPLMTSSHGVGQLISACLDHGLRRLLIGLGGSATVDGGAGMLAALGVRFLNSAGSPLHLPLTGGQLVDIAALDLTDLDPRLADTRIEIACDVDNPLCGARGAAAVFGPQKGANAAQVLVLDEGLRQLYALLQAALGRSVTEHPGAGAAGGLGAALLLVLDAELKSGVEVVMDALGLERLVAGATLIVTGEGRVDAQTLCGKAPAGVARLARRLDIPVIAVGGSLDAVDTLRESDLFDAIEAAVVRPCSLSEALRDAEPNLIDAGIRIGMWLRLLSRI